MKKIIHAFLFHLSWGACLFGALNDAVWISFGVSVTCVVLTVLLSSPKRRLDFFKVAVIVFLGIACEFLNLSLPLYEFTTPSSYPPTWIMCFWLAFSIMFLETLSFFYDKPVWLRFLVGFIGGAGYWAGEWLGLMSYQQPQMATMGAFATLWGLEFLVLLRLSEFIDQQVQYRK